MKKYIFGVAILLAVCVSPMLVQAQTGLTSTQIQSILSLLSSFGADSATVANVNAALGGTPTITSSHFCYNFNNDITVGNGGADVTALNQALSSSGVDTTGNTSNFTENNAGDVVSFQAKYGIRQTGYVGQLTRGKLNALYGCSNQPTPPTNPTKPTITTTSLPNGTVGASYGASVTGAGGNSSDGYNWSVTGLPDGMQALTSTIMCALNVIQPCVNRSGVSIAGTPTTAGTYTVTVTLNAGTQTVSKQFTLVITDGSNDGQYYPTETLLTPQVNGYSVSQNGVAAAVVGKLDSTWCATINPNAATNTGPFEFNWGDGSISCSWFPGTHTYSTATNYHIAVRVADTTGRISSRDSTVNIPSATPTITTTSLPNGTVGASYSASITGSGGRGSYSWSVTGLPPGLNSLTAMISCTSSAGQVCPANFAPVAISGTPTTAGTYRVTVTLTSGTQTVSKQFTLVIAAASVTPIIACLNGATNPPTCTINGCQNKWWFDSTHSTCSSQQFCGAYMYLGLQTFDSQSACQTALPASTSAPTITTTSLPNGTVGTSYSASIVGNGGSSSNSYNWSVTGLPDGFQSISPTIMCADQVVGQPCVSRFPATIVGTPTRAGTYTVTVTLNAGAQTVSKQFSLIISDSVHALPFCAQPPMPNCPAGLQCMQVMPAPKTYTSNDAFNNDKATYLYAGNCTSQNTAPTITTVSLPSGIVGATYNASLTGLGGTGWSATGLPAGLGMSGLSSMSTCSGPTATTIPVSCPTSTSIVGTPTTAGTYTVTVTLAGTQTVSKQFTIVIAPIALLLGNGGTNQTASALNAFNSAADSASQTQTGFTYVWNYDLQIGSPYSADVSALQTALTKEGVYTGEITGGFYDQTFAAVKAFQQKYGIEATGYVGSITRAKLNALY